MSIAPAAFPKKQYSLLHELLLARYRLLTMQLVRLVAGDRRRACLVWWSLQAAREAYVYECLLACLLGS